MSDKSKERDELMKLYYERNKEFEAAKGRRMLFTFLFFLVSYYVTICLVFGCPSDLKSAVAILLPTAFAAIVHYMVNSAIFGYLHVKGREEYEILERIRKRIAELK